MHVVLVTELFLPGTNGVVTAVRNLAQGLRQAGQDVTLIAPASGAASSWASRTGVKLHALQGMTLPANIRQHVAVWSSGEARGVEAILQSADIVHLHSPFVMGLAIGRIALKVQIPIVVTNHALPENITCALRLPVAIGVRLFESVLWRIVEKGIRMADLITSPTRYAAGVLQSRFGDIDVEIISNGVVCADKPKRPQAIGQNDGPLRALYVGRLQREKRIDELLYAVIACTHSAIPVHLTIVGTGPDEARLTRLTKRLGLQDRVCFTGQIDDASRNRLYERSHFLWIASRAELQCCAALEAMASGRPVIAANAGAMPETIRDGYSGRLYTPGDVQQIADIVDELKRDPEMYGALSRGAYLVATNHNLSSVCRSALNAYSSIH